MHSRPNAFERLHTVLWPPSEIGCLDSWKVREPENVARHERQAACLGCLSARPIQSPEGGAAAISGNCILSLVLR